MARDYGYGPALGDIVQWGGRVPPGGTMFLHDSFNAVGLTLAQLRALAFGRRFRFVRRCGPLSEYRAEDLTGRQSLANGARQLAQLAYAARSKPSNSSSGCGSAGRPSPRPPVARRTLLRC